MLRACHLVTQLPDQSVVWSSSPYSRLVKLLGYTEITFTQLHSYLHSYQAKDTSPRSSWHSIRESKRDWCVSCDFTACRGYVYAADLQYRSDATGNGQPKTLAQIMQGKPRDTQRRAERTRLLFYTQANERERRITKRPVFCVLGKSRHSFWDERSDGAGWSYVTWRKHVQKIEFKSRKRVATHVIHHVLTLKVEYPIKMLHLIAKISDATESFRRPAGWRTPS